MKKSFKKSFFLKLEKIEPQKDVYAHLEVLDLVSKFVKGLIQRLENKEGKVLQFSEMTRPFMRRE